LKSNTISNITREGLEYLQASNIDNPHLNIQLILMEILEKNKIFILTNPGFTLTKEQAQIFWGLITARAQGFPLQYIVRRAEFMGLDFYVDPRVLIPRPDTETLVETVIEHIKDNKIKAPRILDIGTGSGAIAVSLAHHVRGSRVTTVDISKGALEVGAKNAWANHVSDRVEFVHSDLFKNVVPGYDVIVSNPPYIPREDINNLMREVKDFEPMSALDGGEDGLDFYREIIDKSPNYLNPGGFIALEGGHDQGILIKQLLQDKGSYKDIALVKDLAGIDRVVTAKI